MLRSRSNLLLVLAALLLATPAWAQGPRARAEEPVVDVGEVSRGQAIRHDFIIRNAGTATLELTEVKPACGCTVTEYDATIAPGATGKVRAVVDTESFSGAIAKSVTVFTNDPENPRLNLVVKAYVRQHVVARPGYARFVTVQGEAAETSEQTVFSEDRPELTVLQVRSPYPFLKARHARDPGGDGRWKIELTLDRDAPSGPMADYVIVRTDHPEQPEVKIAVSGLVRPIIVVAPRVADFGRRELSEPQLKSLEVKNLGQPEVELTEVLTDVAGLEAEIEPVEQGRHYRIRLTLNPGLPQGEFEGLLTIFTSSARQPVLEVPLRGTIL